ncbi:MAG: Uncharacterized MFS-type transporter, partial [uncultured Actinomycetospora sp.]
EHPSRWSEPPNAQAQSGRREHGRHHHRVVRLLPLQHRRRPGVRALVLRQQRGRRRPAGVLDPVRGVRGASDRRRDLRALRRPHRAQAEPGGDAADHGRGDGADRVPAHLRDHRHRRADPPDAVAGHAGHRCRRRVGRRGAHVHGVGHPQAARPDGGVAAGGRAHRAGERHGRRLLLLRPGVPRVGLAGAVPRQHRPHRRRALDPSHRPRVAGVRPGQDLGEGRQAAAGRDPAHPVARRRQGPAGAHRRAGAVLPVHLVRARVRHPAARARARRPAALSHPRGLHRHRQRAVLRLALGPDRPAPRLRGGRRAHRPVRLPVLRPARHAGRRARAARDGPRARLPRHDVRPAGGPDLRELRHRHPLHRRRPRVPARLHHGRRPRAADRHRDPRGHRRDHLDLHLHHHLRLRLPRRAADDAPPRSRARRGRLRVRGRGRPGNQPGRRAGL